jgi:hypothetical protein
MSFRYQDDREGASGGCLRHKTQAETDEQEAPASDKAVKYTSLADVWAEIDYNARSEADKASITNSVWNAGNGTEDRNEHVINNKKINNHGLGITS